MRSSRLSLKIPWPIREALNDVCHEGKYKSIHACIIGALIEKVQNHRRAKWVHGIANLNPKKQDYLLDKMLAFPIEIEDAIEYFRKVDGAEKK